MQDQDRGEGMLVRAHGGWSLGCGVVKVGEALEWARQMAGTAHRRAHSRASDILITPQPNDQPLQILTSIG